MKQSLSLKINVQWFETLITPQWSILTGDREGQGLIDLPEDAFFFQSVQKPTRGNIGLHLVLTNDYDLIHTCKIAELLTDSDYNIVRIKLNLQINIKENVLLPPNYKNVFFFKYKKYTELLSCNQLLFDTCMEKRTIGPQLILRISLAKMFHTNLERSITVNHCGEQIVFFFLNNRRKKYKSLNLCKQPMTVTGMLI